MNSPYTSGLSHDELFTHPIVIHMMYVFSRQEEDEQDAEWTRYKNKKGFTAVDAKICSSILTFALEKNRISFNQLRILFQKSEKYSKQKPTNDFDVYAFKENWLQRHPSPPSTPPLNFNECLISDD